MKPKTIFNISVLFFMIAWSGCEKDITVKLPTAEIKLVVEGHIEAGLPPYVILTRNVPYFSLTDISDLETLFIHGAEVQINDGAKSYTLIEYCSDSLPDSLLPLASLFLGVKMENLTVFNFCAYAFQSDTANSLSILLGELGKTYQLTVKANEKTLTSTTTIPYPIPLDSIWFIERPANDGFGQLGVRLTDPPQAGNNYRVFTQRLTNDNFFVPVKESVLQDKLFNGTTVDLVFGRGNIPGIPDVNAGFFQIGDTVVVKWCVIDRPHFEFWRTAQIEFDNFGNPIAASTQIATNIQGGLGIWGGYGAVYDTLVIK